MKGYSGLSRPATLTEQIVAFATTIGVALYIYIYSK